MRGFRPLARLFCLAFAMVLCAAAGIGEKAEIIEVRRLWTAAPHSAFTDLARYQQRWYLVFREGTSRVSGDGIVRILSSNDGERWRSAGTLFYNGGDLRDPKLAVSPSKTLMLSATAVIPSDAGVRHQTLIWFSGDGRDWSDPVQVGDPNLRLWRVSWHDRRAFAVGYSTTAEKYLRLYTSKDGVFFKALADQMYSGDASESALFSGEEDSLYCVSQHEGSSLLGISRPPYRGWTWRELDTRIAAPNILQLPDGRLVIAGRFHAEESRTALGWLDPKEGTVTRFLTLPSGGDNSSPGLVWYDGILWVSYHSSHEGKASVYLAKVKVPTLETRKRTFDPNKPFEP